MENINHEAIDQLQKQSTTSEQPKQNQIQPHNNFIVILLSVLLLISVFIAGFFAYQTQMLVSELTKLKNDKNVSAVETPTTLNIEDYFIKPDSTTGYQSYRINLPAGWKQIEHSSNFQNVETFQDAESIYKLVIKEEKNVNDQTGKSFNSLKELSGLSYDSEALIVNDESAIRVLPRAGSENIYKVLFFSPDKTLFYDISLETPIDGSMIKEGQILFDQILSTFKFVGTKLNLPKSVSTLFDSINTKFNLNLSPVEENKFYSPNGLIDKKSWKLDLMKANLGKQFVTYLRTQLTPIDNESSGIGGGGIEAYENDSIKCYHSHMYQGSDTHNYLTCSEK